MLYYTCAKQLRVLCAFAFIFLVGCATTNSELAAEIDTQQGLSREAPDTSPPIPPLQIDIPKKTVTRFYNIEVEEGAASEVLERVAEEAGLQLDLRYVPEHRVQLQLENATLERVLEPIFSACLCRYELTEFSLVVLPDEPYSQSYAVDYLNIERQLVANLAIATRVGNLSVASSQSDNRGNASLTGVTSKSVMNLWQSIDEGLRSLLQIQPGQPQLQVNSDAGLIVVHARHKQQQLAKEYLHQLQSRMRRQVSIEAQVIEIDLNKGHSAGVDWHSLANHEGLSWLQTMSSNFSSTAQAAGAVLQYKGGNGSTSTQLLVNLLKEFGKVRVISTPRVVALNNQPSVLSVVENKVYFSSSVKRQSNTDELVVTESVETAIHTVPVGLVMQVIPQISLDGEVLMSIRPTISRVSGYVNDPNPSLAKAGVVSRIPEIQVRELETVLRVSGGQTVVLGGMMQLRSSESRQHVPWLHKLPGLGLLFSSLQKQARQAELLVLLTPTVLPVDGLL